MTALDQLTGLPTFTALARIYQARPGETKHYEMSVALLDIDSFIYVNDQFGWQVADQILSDIADILRNETKGHSISLFRVAGDEFVLASTEEPKETFIGVVRKIQNAVYQKKFPFPGHFGKDRDRVTISIAISFTTLDTAIDCLALLNKLKDNIVKNKNSDQDNFQVFCI